MIIILNFTHYCKIIRGSRNVIKNFQLHPSTSRSDQAIISLHHISVHHPGQRCLEEGKTSTYKCCLI